MAERTSASANFSRPDARGHFEGYASLFHITDLGRDMMMPGAFAQSLRTRSARDVRLLWQHDATRPIGRWLDIREDDLGLRVRGELNLDVPRSRDCLALLRQGAIDGLSIGFRSIRATRERNSGLRRLLQVDLWEISIVTFPMLPQARVLRG